jgi:hypothetical protein
VNTRILKIAKIARTPRRGKSGSEVSSVKDTAGYGSAFQTYSNQKKAGEPNQIEIFFLRTASITGSCNWLRVIAPNFG